MADASSLAPEHRAGRLRHGIRHLLSLVPAGFAFGFVATGPHSAWAVLPVLVFLTLPPLLDAWSPQETHQPPPALPRWPFDALLYLLFALQVATIVLAARLVSTVGLVSLDTLLLVPVLVAASSFSIITAHELIHRRERRFQWMGRILMGLVLYEHFYTEHLRGHHRRVGTAEDPATARHGESFLAFWRRTIPAQFRSAWRLEAARLGDADMKPWDPRILRSRVLHGLVLEWGFAFTLWAVFGPGAFLVHLVQAFHAASALEVVNYFEHWGLRRQGARVRPADSWDTTSAFTLYSLIGLSRHADHHAHASRPYQDLRHWDESPKLPHGYFGMVQLALFRNRRFQELMDRELQRRGLGPFADATGGTA